jgi:aldehyde dehydrogenase (NAD(P)+)
MDSAHIDTELEELSESKQRWARLPIADKLAYLDSIQSHTVAIARPWVEAAVKAKGLSIDDQLAGEEWTSGPYSILSLVNALRQTLVRLEAGVPVLDGYRTSVSTSGQVIVDVFPSSLDERLMYPGTSAQVWMGPGVTLDTLDDTIASFYRDREPEGAVSVVLAAGNIASIAPMDVLYALFNEGRVVVLKMNPVNDYLGEFLEVVFADLVRDGYVRFAYGGVDVGHYLTTHPVVDSIHITGHGSTYEAIIYGSGEEGLANKLADRRVNHRTVAAELGGVAPMIVVPGPWSARDLRHQAEQIVSTKMHNSGFNCIAAQVLILPEGWEHADALLAQIRTLLAGVRDRVPYYPGSLDRIEEATSAGGSVEEFGADHRRYLVTELDPDDAEHPMFTTEVFGPVLGVTTLPCPDVASYLRKAVRLANERLYGTLGANIIIHPSTERRHRKALERAIADLRYGSVAVNTWTGVAYFMPKGTWGAYPGHGPQDIQSGTGVVHNALMFERAEKTVVRGPFAPGQRAWIKGEFHAAPKPIYFVTNRQAHRIGELLVPYSDSLRKIDLARVASFALRA